MKFLLILLVLASCGKHQEPSSKDLRDSDGDQILNYQESELDKYVANIETIGAVKGSLKFKADQFYSLELSNENDLKAKIPAMLVRNEKRINFQEHFAEGSQLKIQKPQKMSLKNLEYEVVFQPHRDSAVADELYFEAENRSYKLTDWSSQMKFKILADDLNLLALGEGKLILKKKYQGKQIFSEDASVTIKNKTYKLYFNDGKSPSIYYVSKELDLKSFLKLKGIEARIVASEDDFFFHMGTFLSKEWIAREYSNGDKILSYGDSQELVKGFLKNYNVTKSNIIRRDGVPLKGLTLKNKDDATVYLKISNITQTKREFEEKKYEKKYGGHEETKYTCKHRERWIAKEYEIAADLNTLFENVELLGNNIVTLQEESESIWNMKLSSPSNAVVELIPTRPESRTKIGLISGPCGEKNGVIKNSDEEGFLSFELESYVEKI